MFRHVCTGLPNPVQVVRIPDAGPEKLPVNFGRLGDWPLEGEPEAPAENLPSEAAATARGPAATVTRCKSKSLPMGQVSKMVRY